MIAANDSTPRLTPDEYLVWEEVQLEKHEYINGEVYAMSGGSVNHGRIAIRLTSLFDTHLDRSGCITGNSDIKVKIVEAQNYIYPDASVTCDDRDKTTTQYITYPCLAVLTRLKYRIVGCVIARRDAPSPDPVVRWASPQHTLLR